MKQILKFGAYFLLAGFVFIACEEDPLITPDPITNGSNKPPVANAGTDMLVKILSCSNTSTFAIAELDGTGSSGPGFNSFKYNWAVLYGPPGYILRNATLAKTLVDYLSPGIYAFELTVRNVGGLTSKDTILITILGNAGIPEKYDLDIMINASFIFLDNYPYDWEEIDPWYSAFYDETRINGKGIFQPFGEYNLNAIEFAETPTGSDLLYKSSIQIQSSNYIPYASIIGDLSGVNFKKLIRDGGGSFTGTVAVTGGSAKDCDANVFTNLPPLTVTGSLNVVTHAITMRIQGKVYF
jgi:hypothetical protein